MAQKQTLKPLTPFQTLFKESFFFFKKNFNDLLPLVLISLAIFFAFGIVLGIVGGGASFWVVLAKQKVSLLIAIICFSLLTLMLLAAIFIFQMLAQATLVWAIKEADENRRIDFKKVWREIFSRAKSVIGVNILVTLAVTAGYILLIIPGLIFGIWFSFSIFFLLIKNKKGREALRESKRLVTGYFWPVALRIIILTLAVSVISLFLSFIPFIGALASMAISLFVLPFSNIYFYFIYKELNNLKRS